MTVTLDELISALEDLRTEIAGSIGSEYRAGETEVRFASQPSYPLQHALDDRPPAWTVSDAGDPVAWLPDGGQVDGGYLPGEVAELLGWS
jgi:hypothetical protein